MELLLDAGYCADVVIGETLARDISLPCPQGRQPGQSRRNDRYFPKDRFVYRPDQDCYICPAGAPLTPAGRYRGNDHLPAHVRYATTACAGCTLRGSCTRSANGRRFKRYAGDDAKDALRETMAHPPAQQIFRRRQAMVEPVFSALRQAQGLVRFRRRGQAGVRREFALHILAYNLSRAVVLDVPAPLARRLYALVRAYLRNACDRIVRPGDPRVGAAERLVPT